MQILAVKVHYQSGQAYVAGVAFRHWHDGRTTTEYVSHIVQLEEPSAEEFYLRDVSCILKLLQEHDLSPETLVIDGYVYLDGVSIPGVGWHLQQALGGELAVVGVATKLFSGIDPQCAILRGNSTRALHVTALGLSLQAAKDQVATMHGIHRIPTIIKRADRLSRDAAKKALKAP